MLRKRRRGMIATAAVSVMALLAIGGVAAGSAQAASWHVSGAPYSESHTFYGHGYHEIKLDLYVRNTGVYWTSITCKGEVEYPNEVSRISKGNHLNLKWDIFGCAFPPSTKCTITNAPTALTYDGTGESGTVVQTGSYFETAAETGCEFAKKSKVTFDPSFAFTYGEPEQMWLVFKGSGTGEYGALTMKVSTTGANVLSNNPVPWGWY